MKVLVTNPLQVFLFILIFFLSSCGAIPKSNSDFTKNNRKHTNKSHVTHKRTKPHPPKTRITKYPTSPKVKKDKTSQTRSSIVRIAQAQQGIPYVWGGKTTSGFDCSGFACYVYSQAGVNICGNTNDLSKLGKRVSHANAQKGDLVFFGKNNRISHVGILIDAESNKFELIHSTSSRGVVQENIQGKSYWQDKFLYIRSIL